MSQMPATREFRVQGLQTLDPQLNPKPKAGFGVVGMSSSLSGPSPAETSFRFWGSELMLRLGFRV